MTHFPIQTTTVSLRLDKVSWLAFTKVSSNPQSTIQELLYKYLTGEITL